MPDDTARLTRAQCDALYAELLGARPEEARSSMRFLARHDLYFLLSCVCGRTDVGQDWVYERIREVEAEPDGYLDLWSRGHFKSSVITFGLSLQDILRDPEITIIILSYNRPTAKTFLRQLKREFEVNTCLYPLFPDVCWENPTREAPQWSEDGGIIVRRKGNPKEATVEAYGLVDSQPVARHPRLVVYDDVVTRESVSTPEMSEKTTTAFQESLALGAQSGAIRRGAGTRWGYADTYQHIIDVGTLKPRIHPARDADGKPVLMTEAQLADLYRDMGPAVFSAQMLLEPKTESELGFDESSIRYYRDHRDGAGLNIYIVVDPANSRKKDSSYTAMAVIGLGADGCYYWLDGIRDRIGLDDRVKALFSLHRRWQGLIGPGKQIKVGYECYGVQEADIETLGREMERQNYRFPIVALRGRASKDERIPRLEPDYREHRWWWPETMLKVRKNGESYDLVAEFKNDELLAYPFGRHPDMLDAMSRIYDADLGVVWPLPEDEAPVDRYRQRRDEGRGRGSWMAA